MISKTWLEELDALSSIMMSKKSEINNVGVFNVKGVLKNSNIAKHFQ